MVAPRSALHEWFAKVSSSFRLFESMGRVFSQKSEWNVDPKEWRLKPAIFS